MMSPLLCLAGPNQPNQPRSLAWAFDICCSTYSAPELADEVSGPGVEARRGYHHVLCKGNSGPRRRLVSETAPLAVEQGYR